MLKKIYHIFLICIPVLLMIALIPFVINDVLLAIIYIFIIAGSLTLKNTKNDFLVLFLGAVIMIVSETFFIHSGVETFNRTTLFGIMPVWLPILWGYAFVAIKRALQIL